MGKILQFPSPEQRQNNGEGDSAGDLPNPNSEITALRSRIRLEGPPPKEFIPKLTLVLADLGPLIQQVPASRRARLGTHYQHLVKDYTEEQLIGFIMRSDQLELAQKPMFYKAIVDEIELREIIEM